MVKKADLVRIDDTQWEIPKGYRSDMRVPARVYATEKMIDAIVTDRSLEQIVNVATLPGIRRNALVMPDVHEGYGFPIGGVAAFGLDDGIISPGGIGYDINCGVRLLQSRVKVATIASQLPKLAHELARVVPSGVGRGGRNVFQGKDLDRILEGGAARAVELGFGDAEDLQRIESGGTFDGADASAVSEQAKSRGRDQCGTIGSGNHFVEIDVVDEIFDEEEAANIGVSKGDVAILIHTGSRGLGHQIATDYIKNMLKSMQANGITVPDRELACAPFRSPVGQRYLQAMAAGANFAWANRQMITAQVRSGWKLTLGDAGGPLSIIYDVAHNVAKIEEYEIDGRREKLVVHRKGATRAFPGQPVLIPGSMGTASYFLVGTEGAMKQTFGSCCHGAGRRMSRGQARREVDATELRMRLKSLGIAVEAGSTAGLVEEAPEAYKDIESVVDVVHRAGIARKVARLRPVGGGEGVSDRVSRACHSQQV